MLGNRVSRATMLFLTRSTTILAILAFAEHSFGAQFSTWQSADYAILMEANSSLTVSGTSPVDKIYGNVGFGDTTATTGGGTFTGTGATGATVNGHQPGNIANTISGVSFAATNSQTYTPGSVTVSSEAGSVTQVTTALSQLNTISTNENIAGYSTTISAGTSLNITGVTPNDGGDIVYTATIASNMSSATGGIFDILGSANQTVIFNITGASPTLEGVINLEGPTDQGSAIKTPNVIFNFTSAGNTFTMNTGRSGNTLDTEGIFLDQAGKFAVTNSRIFGLLVGSACSTFNTSEIFFTPEPSGLVLAALGIVCLGGAGWRKAKRQRNAAKSVEPLV
jgi:hypothetical protein